MALGLSYVRHFRLSSHRIYCLSSRGHFVCLVSSFRYNGLATLALAGPSGPRAGPSGPLRALRARICIAKSQIWGLARGGPLQLKAAPEDEPKVECFFAFIPL